MVSVVGFEPTAFPAQTECSTKLSYTEIVGCRNRTCFLDHIFQKESNLQARRSQANTSYPHIEWGDFFNGTPHAIPTHPRSFCRIITSKPFNVGYWGKETEKPFAA